MKWHIKATKRERMVLNTMPGMIRLSANEAPFPPIPELYAAVATAMGQINRYPDPEAHRLRETLATRYGVALEQVVVGSGSSELVQSIIFGLGAKGHEILIPKPSFPMYTHTVARTEARPVFVAIREDGAVDLDAILQAVTPATSLAIVCNPNNPTGTFLIKEEIEDFMDRMPSDVVILLDEAYWELTETAFDPKYSTVPFLAKYPNLIITRTFSKFYGLAGLRVGFALTANSLVAESIVASGPGLMISRLAQEVAITCLELEAVYRQKAVEIIEERTRVRDILLELGYAVYPSQTNFLTFPFPTQTVPFVEAGIQVRGGDSMQMPGYIRISLGTENENDQVIAILRNHVMAPFCF